MCFLYPVSDYCLQLQVSVLTDQVEAQGEKIRDLEVCLEGHQLKLNATEEMLQQELLSRTQLETQKLDLMAEVSDLKIKLVGMEKEQSEYEEKQNKAESVVNLISELQEQMCRLQLEINSKIQERKSHSRKPSVAALGPQSSTESMTEIPTHDRRIEELTVLLSQYRRVKEIMIAVQGTSERVLSSTSEDDFEATLRKWNRMNKPQMEIYKPEVAYLNAFAQVLPRELTPPMLPPPPQKVLEIRQELTSHFSFGGSPVPTNTFSTNGESLEFQNRVSQKKISSSLEDLQSESLEKNRPHVKSSKYQTLPGKLFRPAHGGDNGIYNTPGSPSTCRVNGNEDNGIQNLRDSDNMDGTMTSEDLSPLSSGTESGAQSPLSPESKRSPKGIKKIWGKIRRTQSGNFPGDDLGLVEFRRGGLRATAGPRLSRSKDTKGQKNDHNAPFAQWGTERVCSWLEDFGLGQYVIFARQWVTSGHTLLTATPQDMEKELGIKHPLHRKKLVLAVKAINTKQDDKSAQLDHIWVTRWLDDIGLPQYKDQFHESRVDGRMLQYLTVILEPRFNGDTLAMLLNIPPQKTLLRRHLTTNFNVLIGPEAQQEKREIVESTAYTPLTTTAKVRPKKLGFSHFGNLRKKKFDESTDYICPMDTYISTTNGTQKIYSAYKVHSALPDKELDKLDQVGQVD
ncbi:hypothetical protein JD844_021724 [Phrynosoma platyrhinos]|uniref:SAM domain-containing protein n=1 Tax=Phrynosoma platyrhinos TaxID=52577 RepID=A0ABQ7SUC5_PHRPL|nr:hypothetical protein JD844_021724 [Phrynosoma platyrhinos]